jgi:hypothetical protein
LWQKHKEYARCRSKIFSKRVKIVGKKGYHSQKVVVASTKNILYKQALYGIIIHEEGIAEFLRKEFCGF